ncbi:MAG TPA: hypothetical protein VEF76_05475 [Patescibacteria group bacterium]|nr:hypothetical protein [Patescibacteria group bacterium]
MPENSAINFVQPVFSERDDHAFFVSYLEQKAEETLKNGKWSLWKLNRMGELDHIPEKGRPNMRLTYELAPGETAENAKAIGQQNFSQVFKIPMTVRFNQAAGKVASVEFEVGGATSNLVREILEKDAAVVRRGLWRLEDRIGWQIYPTIIAALDRHDRPGQLAAAIEQGRQAPKTAVFRRKP